MTPHVLFPDTILLCEVGSTLHGIGIGSDDTDYMGVCIEPASALFGLSTFEQFEYAKVAPLFKRLSENFERCVYGLNVVKNDLQEMQHPIVRQTAEILM